MDNMTAKKALNVVVFTDKELYVAALATGVVLASIYSIGKFIGKKEAKKTLKK